MRDTVDTLDAQLKDLQQALAEKALIHSAAVMPGFTHLQSAQPVTFGHHLLAYVEMLGRDRGRLADARKRLNECPLGAAALAGTSFPIDRLATASALGFDRPTANSLDSVSDRDFVLETLAAASICAMHLPRFAEEIVIWTTPLFGFVALSDRFTTGSSIMPQKRNPDAAELVRGKVGRVVGALVALLMVMKGLALAYAKDMQEDKERTFDALQTLSLLPRRHGRHGARPAARPEAHEGGRRRGLRHRHRPGGLAGARARPALPRSPSRHRPPRRRRRGQGWAGWKSLTLAEMQEVEPRITQGVFAVPSAETFGSQPPAAHGGTAPANVRAQAQALAEAAGEGRLTVSQPSVRAISARSRSPVPSRRYRRGWRARAR